MKLKVKPEVRSYNMGKGLGGGEESSVCCGSSCGYTHSYARSFFFSDGFGFCFILCTHCVTLPIFVFLFFLCSGGQFTKVLQFCFPPFFLCFTFAAKKRPVYNNTSVPAHQNCGKLCTPNTLNNARQKAPLVAGSWFSCLIHCTAGIPLSPTHVWPVCGVVLKVHEDRVWW